MEGRGKGALLTTQADEALCRWQEHNGALGGTPRKQALSATETKKISSSWISHKGL